MGFRDAKRRLIASVLAGDYQHEPREVVEGKNLLDTGDVTPGEVADLVGRCRGNQYGTSPHHAAPDVEVHVFRPVLGAEVWYIKVYFLDDPDGGGPAVFISVHKSEFRKRR
jgi:hypothetical protein